MAKKKYLVIVIVLILICVIYVIHNYTTSNNTPFSEQVKSIRVADSHDFSTMGNSYSDKIYEKYDAITFGRQSIDVIGLFNEPIEWIVLERDEENKKAL